MLNYKKYFLISKILILTVFLTPSILKVFESNNFSKDVQAVYISPAVNRYVKCCYSDGRTSSCINDLRSDYMCGAWLGGSGKKIGCYETCPKPTPTPNYWRKCCYSDINRGRWESSCFSDPRGDYMCGAWLGGGGRKVGCNELCPQATPTPTLSCPNVKGWCSSSSKVHLIFSQVPGAYSYRVYRDGSYKGYSTSNTFDDTNVSCGISHSYNVNPYSSAGQYRNCQQSFRITCPC